MANSRFEYVKKFELDDALLPSCWIVVRLDGKGFTKYECFSLASTAAIARFLWLCAAQVLRAALL